MKESVTKFNLEAAFKALDEIEIPVARRGIAANKVNLKETFNKKSKLDLLIEDYYDVNDTAELEAAKEEREAEIAKAKLARIEKIVDLDAESSEDLLTSYVGKVIIQCPQCMTLFYKDEADVVKSEDDATVVNVNETCQHCGNISGYTLVGKVDKVGEEEASEYDIDDFDENELNLDFDEPVSEDEETEEAEETNEEDLDLEPVTTEDETEETEEENTEEEVKESLTLNEDVEDEVEVETEEEFLDEEEVIEDDAEDIVEEPVEEILTSVEEVKEVAVEAAEAVLEASEEETLEDIKEVTDEVVEDHFEISEEETEEPTEENEEENEEEVIEESLNEAVDKELDDKLKAHNEYIEYLKEMIEKEEKSLASAKNDFVKKSIQSRIDALKADLEAALPEALKGEIETELPTPEESGLEDAAENKEEEEVKESLIESTLVENEKTVQALQQENKNLEAKLAELETTYKTVLEGERMYNTADEAGKKVLDKLANGDYLKSIAFDLNEYKTKKDNYEHQINVNNEIIKNGGNKLLKQSQAMIDKNGKEIEVESLNENVIININVEGEKEEAPVIIPVEANVETDCLPEVECPVESIVEPETEPEAVEEPVIEEPVKETETNTPVEEIPVEEEEPIKEDIETEEKLAEVESELDNTNIESTIVEETESKITNALDSLIDSLNEEKVVEAKKEVSDEEFRAMLKNPVFNEKLEEELPAVPEEPFIKAADRIKNAGSEEETTVAEEENVEDTTNFEELEDFDEESFEESVSNYLKEVYENVASFKTSNCKVVDKKFVIEGVINFNSGNTKNTSFSFEAVNNNLTGINEDLAESKAFTLNYKVEDKTLITESLAYSYKIDNNLVEGLIKNNK